MSSVSVGRGGGTLLNEALPSSCATAPAAVPGLLWGLCLGVSRTVVSDGPEGDAAGSCEGQKWQMPPMTATSNNSLTGVMFLFIFQGELGLPEFKEYSIIVYM